MQALLLGLLQTPLFLGSAHALLLDQLALLLRQLARFLVGDALLGQCAGSLGVTLAGSKFIFVTRRLCRQPLPLLCGLVLQCLFCLGTQAGVVRVALHGQFPLACLGQAGALLAHSLFRGNIVVGRRFGKRERRRIRSGLDARQRYLETVVPRPFPDNHARMQAVHVVRRGYVATVTGDASGRRYDRFRPGCRHRDRHHRIDERETRLPGLGTYGRRRYGRRALNGDDDRGRQNGRDRRCVAPGRH